MDKPTNQPPQPKNGTLRDLAPHAGAGMEWWFCQGYFEATRTGRRDFMFTLWRRQARSGDRAAGWELLLSVIDPAAGTKDITSRISGSKAQAFRREAYGDLTGAGMPEELARAFVDEIAAFGPLPPTRVSDEPVRASTLALDHAWGDFSLKQDVGGSVLAVFTLPGSTETCRLRLTPRAPWFHDEHVGPENSTATMQYASCPRLELTGDIAGAPVTGQAWFDHQWGGQGWFEPDAGTHRFLGWEWLAINLDNGDDLLLSVGRDMQTCAPVISAAVLFQPGQSPRAIRNIESTALEHWQSAHTFATYPVAWQFRIVELDAVLSFRPGQFDCEAPLFGLAGTVWEGPGTVTGTIGQDPVSGRGHLELFGYAYPTDFDRYQKQWIARIDARIEAFLPKKIDDAWMQAVFGPARWRYAPEVATRMISDPTWDLISRGGKHWRSVFGILMLRALGEDVEPFEELITVIPELLHAGSLMVDDIEDKSTLRRGGPAIHQVYGEPATINAGNTLYFLPLLIVSRHPLLSLQQRNDIYRISYDLFIRAHFGQAQDLYSEQWVDRGDVLGNLDRYAQDVLQTYTFKTAAPVRALAEILGVIAGSDAKTGDACAAYAEAAGIAYQIIDDVNNFIGDERWGKEVGEDIRERRLTYVVIRALGALPPADQRRLWQILQSGAGGSMGKADQAEACDLVRRSGALESARVQARTMVDDAWQALSPHIAPSQSKVLLRLLVTRLFSNPAT